MSLVCYHAVLCRNIFRRTFISAIPVLLARQAQFQANVVLLFLAVATLAQHVVKPYGTPFFNRMAEMELFCSSMSFVFGAFFPILQKSPTENTHWIRFVIVMVLSVAIGQLIIFCYLLGNAFNTERKEKKAMKDMLKSMKQSPDRKRGTAIKDLLKSTKEHRRKAYKFNRPPPNTKLPLDSAVELAVMGTHESSSSDSQTEQDSQDDIEPKEDTSADSQDSIEPEEDLSADSPNEKVIFAKCCS